MQDGRVLPSERVRRARRAMLRSAVARARLRAMEPDPESVVTVARLLAAHLATVPELAPGFRVDDVESRADRVLLAIDGAAFRLTVEVVPVPS